MTPNPDAMAGLQGLQALVEQYLDVPRVCFICQDAPGVAPMVFVADTSGDGRVHGCCFAVCAVCWCSDDFQARVSEALSTARAKGQGIWN
jgi:hypothetical protein